MGVWKCQTHDLCCVNSILGPDKFCWEDWAAVSIMPFECACVNAREGILHRVMKTRNEQWSFGYDFILSLELGKVNDIKLPKPASPPILPLISQTMVTK